MKVLGRWLVNNDPDQAGALGLAACCLWVLAVVWPHQQEPCAFAVGLKMFSQLIFPSASG